MRQLGVIEDGAILVKNGVIENVGPTRRVENLAAARGAEEINAAGRVVMPAFVDSHTHLIAAPPRISDMRTAGYVVEPHSNPAQSSVNHVRRSSASTLEHQARRLLSGFVRHGTTTVEVKTGYGVDESGEMKMLRVLSHLAESGCTVVPTFLASHIPAAEFPGTLEEYLDWVNAYLIPKVRTRNSARFVDGFCDVSGFTVGQAQRLLNAARRLGFATKLHIEQAPTPGAVRMAVEMGATSVDGLTYAEPPDADVLAQSRTVGVVMPGPMHHRYTTRYAPARMLIDRGAAVALATGFHPPVSSTYNMMTAIAIACTHMGLTPEEAITAATTNGAHALMLASQKGSIEFGKDADLIMLSVSDYREIPYQFGVNLVSMTMRNGQVAYREGAVTCADEKA
jgi:imidazolonepropionase